MRKATAVTSRQGAASASRSGGKAKQQPPARTPAPPVPRPVAAKSASAGRGAPVTRIGPKQVAAPAHLALVRAAAPVKPVAIASSRPPVPVPHSANPFLDALLSKRNELTGNLEETKFDTLAKMGRVAEDDQAQMSHEEFISLQRNSMDYTALRQVNAAIDRLKTGEYGICASCDEPISEKRLKAIPWAKYCVVCQDRVQASGFVDDVPEEANPGESW